MRKEDMIFDDQLHDDLEASEQEMKGVADTAVSFLFFLLVIGTGIFYWLW